MKINESYFQLQIVPNYYKYNSDQCMFGDRSLQMGNDIEFTIRIGSL